jgi:hypothetical protein
MAADEIERADKTALTAAIAQAAFYPTLAIAEELQQPVQDFDAFCEVVRVHDDGSDRANPTYHRPRGSAPRRRRTRRAANSIADLSFDTGTEDWQNITIVL